MGSMPNGFSDNVMWWNSLLGRGVDILDGSMGNVCC